MEHRAKMSYTLQYSDKMLDKTEKTLNKREHWNEFG